MVSGVRFWLIKTGAAGASGPAVLPGGGGAIGIQTRDDLEVKFTAFVALEPLFCGG